MIRFGIIGTNFITEQFIKGASLVEDFKLNAVYSRNEEKAKEFAAKHFVENTFTNLEDMAKSDLIDAVYIASPNSLHAEQSILFLNNKKHVLCEKAIASNVVEISAMIKAAKDNNVLLMEALKSTTFPSFKALKDNLHKIGKVRRYFASYCQYSSRYDKYKEGVILNAFDPKFSNGSIMDIGIYCLYPLVHLFGEPKNIKANGILLDSGVDGQGSLIAEYEDMDGVVLYSKIANSYIPSEIQGENGSIIINSISTPSSIIIKYRNGETEDISVPQEEFNMCYETKEFIDLINNNKIESSINSLEVSLATIKIIETARKQVGVVFPADK